jgi:hypothetical protein
MTEKKSWRKILEHYLELISVCKEARRNSPFIFLFKMVPRNLKTV